MWHEGAINEAGNGTKVYEESSRVINHESGGAAINLVDALPCTVEVLKPRLRITVRRSAFCRGLDKEVVKTGLGSFASVPL